MPDVAVGVGMLEVLHWPLESAGRPGAAGAMRSSGGLWVALIDCAECEGMLSDQAITCPHCGYPHVVRRHDGIAAAISAIVDGRDLTLRIHLEGPDASVDDLDARPQDVGPVWFGLPLDNSAAAGDWVEVTTEHAWDECLVNPSDVPTEEADDEDQVDQADHADYEDHEDYFEDDGCGRGGTVYDSHGNAIGVDQAFVDEVLDGDPDMYWNID